MKLVLFKYNKVTNAAFARIGSADASDLFCNGEQPEDHLTCDEVLCRLKDLKFDAAIVGDIFWPTGQSICRVFKMLKKKLYFLQHGQWIYTKNKINPPELPFCTFVNGYSTARTMKEWSYSARSLVLPVGNPRYDGILRTSEKSESIYFAPPVMEEIGHDGSRRFVHNAFFMLKSLSSLRDLEMRIHPHYREGRVDLLRDLFPQAEIIDPQDDPIQHIICSGKVLTHRNSTTVLDSIACGKIAVLLPPPDERQSAFPRGYFGPFAVEADYRTCLLRCKEEGSHPFSVEGSEYEEAAKEYIYLGNASARILEAINRYN